MSLLGVYCTTSTLAVQAKQLAVFVGCPLIKISPKQLDSGFYVLTVAETGIALQATGKKAQGPIRVDFTCGTSAHRRRFGGGKGQMIAKAIGLKSAYRPHVLDVTAGLGEDGFVLATLGCQMTLVERSSIVYSLLKDGIERAALSVDQDLQQILSCIQLRQQEGVNYLQSLQDAVDIIYLDPMFPERNSKAEVNKSMKACQQIVGEDQDAGVLFIAALEKVIYRIIVKRPRKAPSLDVQFPDLSLPKPSLVFEGKSTRYDVYPLKKMP
ncbi:SAM-dependent methyltransferase [Candidatus Endobugula sertula]|uniref:Ribosomal RNA small subunit methyltransferase J n=1 Tax=Candidatus Endobugula sertula TaxID=62101 RepID=A0A1D2QNE4_9GAMM|nr:SAM-dependent methyltransferase [Candidatus Endobugula sertula]